MTDHFLQVHVLQEGRVFLAHVDPLRDHLVQHLRLFASLVAHAHGVVHRDDGDHACHGENGRIDTLAACRCDHHGADGRTVGAGHAAVAPHALQLEFAQQDKVDEGLQHLCHEPAQKRYGKDRIERKDLVNELHNHLPL